MSVSERGYRLPDLDDVGREHLPDIGAQIEGVVGYPGRDQEAFSGVECQCGLVWISVCTVPATM